MEDKEKKVKKSEESLVMQLEEEGKRKDSSTKDDQVVKIGSEVESKNQEVEFKSQEVEFNLTAKDRELLKEFEKQVVRWIKRQNKMGKFPYPEEIIDFGEELYVARYQSLYLADTWFTEFFLRNNLQVLRDKKKRIPI